MLQHVSKFINTSGETHAINYLVSERAGWLAQLVRHPPEFRKDPDFESHPELRDFHYYCSKNNKLKTFIFF